LFLPYVVILSVTFNLIMLNVIIMNVIMLNVVAPCLQFARNTNKILVFGPWPLVLCWESRLRSWDQCYKTFLSVNYGFLIS
jgi:hypothetical protein